MIGAGIYSGDILIAFREIEMSDRDNIETIFNGFFLCKRLDLKA